MSSKPIALYWLRQDLRLTDNPALDAVAADHQVLPVYILDDTHPKSDQMGSASRLWLHHSLEDLNTLFDGKLALYQGNPIEILQTLVERFDISTVVWNRCYEPWRISRDKEIKSNLENAGITVKSFNGSLLWEPWEVNKSDGTPYKVFTPFYRKGCLAAEPPRMIIPAPESLDIIRDDASLDLADLALTPQISWDKPMLEHWNISESGAQDKLAEFINHGLSHYKGGRDLPAKRYTSQLAPYLHFGQLSPNQVWHVARHQGDDKNIDHFCSELGWREFSYNLLYHNPKLRTQNLQDKFDDFPWLENDAHLLAWQKGLTGIPMVDAGMRELWQTGYMHNRVRMIVGSFLVKNLRLHWHHGEQWFWDTLFDADHANNSASWQWVAGCGADAAPYFRIFNPVTQGQKFDAEGEYVRRWVPELNDLPNKYLFSPWEASDTVLSEAGVTLGKEYPEPIVDLKGSRAAALDAFSSLKKAAD